MKSKTTVETYNELIKKLDNNKKCYYVRFGDGDIFVMMGRNDSYHDYNSKLKSEILQSFDIKDPLYMKGLAVNYENEEHMYEGVFAQFTYNKEIRGWISHNIKNVDSEYYSAIMPHYFSVFKQEKFIHLLDKYIRPKKKMVIASCEKGDAEKLFGEIDYFIKVSDKNCYKDIDGWYEEVLESCDDVDVILPFCGLATRVLAKRLWVSNVETHFLDLGSLIDAVSEKNTRAWIVKEGNNIKNILI